MGSGLSYISGCVVSGSYNRRFPADSHIAYCFATSTLSLLEQFYAFLETDRVSMFKINTRPESTSILHFNFKVTCSFKIVTSEAFDRVNHLSILYKLSFVGIGASVWSILTQFLSNRSQQVMVDGCRSKLVNVVSGLQHGSVLGPLLFLLYTSELFFIL